MYQTALTASESANLEAIIDHSWGAHLRFQMQCFDASASYQYSKVLLAQADSTGEGYGERIAYMKSSVAKCAAAIGTASERELPGSMLGTIESLRKAVQKDLDKATNENNTIYLDIVPPVILIQAKSSLSCHFRKVLWAMFRSTF